MVHHEPYLSSLSFAVYSIENGEILEKGNLKGTKP